MAKYLRPISESYTDFPDKETQETLGRGLQMQEHEDPIPPVRLSDHICEEHKSILRQVIAILDKTAKKKTRLIHFHLKGYEERVHLAAALWPRLLHHYRAIGNPLSETAIADLKRVWNAKAHPYARGGIESENPSHDPNGRKIADARLADEKAIVTPEDHHGVWRTAFWAAKDDEPDYAAIADGIFAHLFEQELNVEGKGRREGSMTGPNRGPLTERGLAETRGNAIAGSASDSREHSKKPTLIWWKPEEADLWPDAECEAERWYFGSNGEGGGDIARIIFDGLGNEGLYADRVYASWFGDHLYRHFGSFMKSLPEAKDDPLKKRIWNLHNAVRQFYQNIAKSDRFRIAVAQVRNDEAKPDAVQKYFPEDKETLLAALRKRRENSQMSDYIRLGKLLVHASDVLHEHDGDTAKEALEARKAYLATSIGQSEIKQVESFTRAWRSAVALTNRTAQAMAGLAGEDLAENDRDITSHPNKIAAYKSLSKQDAMITAKTQRFNDHLPVIFGSRPMPSAGGISRTSIFLEEAQDPKTNSEVLWGFLTLVATVRHRTNHYNVRRTVMTLLEGGILTADQSDNFGGRASDQVHPLILDRFKRLLEFDLTVEKDALRTALEQLKAKEFLSTKQVKQLVPFLAQHDDHGITDIPRFAAMMDMVRRLRDNADVGIHDALRGLATAQPPKPEEQEADGQRCRNGLLRELYQTGFRSWVAEIERDEERSKQVCEQIVATLAASKRERIDTYDKVTRRHYPFPASYIQELGLDRQTSLKDLFRILTRHSIREQDQDIRYRPDGRVLSKAANRIEDFRQEVFAHLFAKYISQSETSLDWLYQVGDHVDNPADLDYALDTVEFKTDHFDKAWHSQFYAWLYMVPLVEASRLRHQMRKSAVMDQKLPSNLDLTVGTPPKMDEKTQKVLRDLDRLFSLYARVQAAGFSGQEHAGAIGHKDLFYEDPSQFTYILEKDKEDGPTSFPGTYRGLRELIRFAHVEPLKRTFAKHKVTRAEVTAFAKLYVDKRKDPRVVNLIKRKEDLRSEIITAIRKGPDENAKKKEQEAFWPSVKGNCRTYKKIATEAAVYNFQANAARLNDHVRLHRLVMRVVGRLTDYALMWERDRLFAFVGMLHRQVGEGGYDLIKSTPDAKGRIKIGIRLKDNSLRKEHADLFEAEKDGNDQNWFIPFLDVASGFDAPKFEKIKALLDDEKQNLFSHHFVEARGINQKDIDRNNEEVKKGHPRRRLQTKGAERQKVRNDLAHQNILDLAPQNNSEKGPILKLTYAVNAVRSLMAYDRKMKNAVPKSIRKLFAEEGLFITWDMVADRLKRPVVYPLVETHLKMVPGKVSEKPITFDLPRASVRLTSMAKAVFDFDANGYGTDRTVAGKSVPVIEYPGKFFDTFPGLPETIRQDTMIRSGSENG